MQKCTLNEDWIISLAQQNNPIVNKVMELMPGWTTATCIGFLLWLGTNRNLNPQQINQLVEQKPTQVISEIHHFQRAEQPLIKETPKFDIPKNHTQKIPSNKLPRGLRNNNPGNIIKGTDKWQGLAENQNDSRFLTFQSPEYGIRAMAIIIKNYQLNTVEKIIHKWAPPNENDTNAYIKTISKKMNVKTNQPINVNDQKIMFILIKSIIEHENGIKGYYSDDVIQRGINMALNKSKSMTMLPDPKIRSKHAPEKFVETFFTPQAEFLSKSASSDLKDSDVGTYHRFYQKDISDTDRYTTDRYSIVVSCTKTKRGHELSLQISSQQTGLSSYCEYWLYTHDQDPNPTYNELKKIVKSVSEQIEFERIPMSLITPYFRNATKDIDVPHKEKSGVYHFNYYMEHGDREQDYRKTLYGDRYPEFPLAYLGDNWINQDDKSKEITSVGTKRNKTYKLSTNEKIIQSNSSWDKIAQSLKKMGMSKQEIAQFNSIYLQKLN